MLEIEKIKCLVVDDHVMMRKILKDFLVSMNINNIAFADNGKMAYEKLHFNIAHTQPQFDIVFLDWNMPDVDGYSVLKQCRSDKNYDKVAFVMVTAEAEKEQVIKAIKTGVTSYIQKPFTENEFKGKMNKVLQWIVERGVGAK
jgi:two-component system chemotaxis response regulator CheY